MSPCYFPPLSLPIYNQLRFPSGSDGKESACNVGDLVFIPGLGRYPGEGDGNPSGHILSQPTLCTTTDLAERYTAHGGHNGFLLEKPAREDRATLQSTPGNSSQSRYTLVCLFPAHPLGQMVTCFRTILRGAHQPGHTHVWVRLTWNRCA